MNNSSKYQLINTLCESRLFRSKADPAKYSTTDKRELLYGVLLATIALALDDRTSSWAQKYASMAAVFGNFDYFRTSATDLYMLIYLSQTESNDMSSVQARQLLRLLRGIGTGSIDMSFIHQTLLRFERLLRINNTHLRNARRTIVGWEHASPAAKKSAITQLHRNIRSRGRLAEVLPYLQVITKGDPGTFGKMTPLKTIAAIAGAGLAGLALGLRHDPNKRWSVFKDDIQRSKTPINEDRATQLFQLVQDIEKMPEVEKVINVNYLADGISAFIRTVDGNAYEMQVRPARFAHGFKQERGVTESVEGEIANPLAKYGIHNLSDVIDGEEGYDDGWGVGGLVSWYVIAPGHGESGRFFEREDAVEHARELFPYLHDDELVVEGWQWRVLGEK